MTTIKCTNTLAAAFKVFLDNHISQSIRQSSLLKETNWQNIIQRLSVNGVESAESDITARNRQTHTCLCLTRPRGASNWLFSFPRPLIVTRSLYTPRLFSNIIINQLVKDGRVIQTWLHSAKISSLTSEFNKKNNKKKHFYMLEDTPRKIPLLDEMTACRTHSSWQWVTGINAVMLSASS